MRLKTNSIAVEAPVYRMHGCVTGKQIVLMYLMSTRNSVEVCKNVCVKGIMYGRAREGSAEGARTHRGLSNKKGIYHTAQVGR